MTRFLRRTLACAVPLLLMMACARLFTPLDQQQAHLESDPAAREPVLIRLATCWAGLPLAEEATAAYSTRYPHVSFIVEPATSEAASRMLSEGQADVAILADGSAGLQTGSEGTGGRLLALDALCIVVGQGSPLEDISREELALLFGGYRLDWGELEAGSGQPEIVVLLGESASARLFQRVVMGQETITTAALVMPHDRGVLEHVAAHPRAVGYLSRAYADERVKVLALDGVRPEAREIREGRYPLAYALTAHLVAQPSEEAAAFVAFLSSAEGRRLIERRYVLPS